MSEKIVTARKQHTCAQCDRPILPGETYTLWEGRGARYDDPDPTGWGDGKQVGVFFSRFHWCHKPDCEKVSHEIGGDYWCDKCQQWCSCDPADHICGVLT